MPNKSAPSKAPTVVIVGRPNVGKSTLFNRLSKTRRALTSPVPGTTRDWLDGSAHWGAHDFLLVDTGGYATPEDLTVPGEKNENAAPDVLAAVRAQVEHWARTADVVLWVVDGAEGMTGPDRAFSRWLRPLARRVILVINKVDDRTQENQAAEFHGLGFPKVFAVSASHGRSINRLLDEIVEAFPARAPAAEVEEDTARVAIVGRPNVGKSSLMNRLLGEERVIVSDRPGTTRDTVDTALKWRDKNFLFMDTAGLRAKKSKADALEGLTRIMSEKALDRCDVALLMVDATEGLLEGDTAVARVIQEKNRACVVGINKWDAIESQERANASQWFRERQPADMPFLDYTPLIFISAKTGLNVPDLLETLWDVHAQYHRRFEDEELSAFFWTEVQNRPYSFHGKKLVFKSAAQVASAPPTFILRTNLTPDQVHFSYIRHLENVFRKKYAIQGSPLVFRFRRGSK